MVPLGVVASLLLVLVFWFVGYLCNQKVSRVISKRAILMFTAVVYFLMMVVYIFYNRDECYAHLPKLDAETTFYLILIPVVAMGANIVFLHLL